MSLEFDGEVTTENINLGVTGIQGLRLKELTKGVNVGREEKCEPYALGQYNLTKSGR